MSQFKMDADSASNGKIAVDKVKYDFEKTCCSTKIRLIFMDINMPVMDGFDATVNIVKLAKERNHELAVVGLTAYHNEEYKLKCFKSGMKLRIIKPLNKVKLSKVM